MRRAPIPLIVVALLGAAGALPPLAADAAPLASVRVHAVAKGLHFPAGFTFAPNGRIFYGERFSGEIRVFDRRTGNDRLFFRIPAVVSDGEQGLLGVAVHPRDPDRPFVYAYATRSVGGAPRNQIVRVRAENGRGTAMRVIFSSRTVAGSYHDGGRILFGPDGMLWAIVGESHDSSNAQDLSTPAGKILRMTPGGKPAPGNPFSGSQTRNGRIWAYGIRNSFGFDFDPRTGGLWETEAGPQCNDELNRILKGRNFGWGPHETCSGQAPRNTNQDGPNPVLPKRWYNPVITPTGAAFCRHCGLGPGSGGRLYFGAYNTGEIRKVALTKSRYGVRRVTLVYNHDAGILSMEASPSGPIFFSDDHAIYRLA